MKLVIVESPYAGRGWIKWFDRWQNKRYARKCMRDCLNRGEAPYASHLLYTQLGVLKDHLAEQRLLGLKAGHAWTAKADYVAVYTDRGITTGMVLGVQKAKKLGIPVEERRLVRPFGINPMNQLINQMLGTLW